MRVNTTSLLQLIKSCEKFVVRTDKSNATQVRSFAISLRYLIKQMSNIDSSVVPGVSITDCTFDSSHYNDMINSIAKSNARIALKGAFKPNVLSQYESVVRLIEKELSTNKSTERTDFNGTIDEFLVVTYAMLLLSIQINTGAINMTFNSKMMQMAGSIESAIAKFANRYPNVSSQSWRITDPATYPDFSIALMYAKSMRR